MKGVPIKFRGKSEVTGKIIYGIGVKVYPDYSTMILDSLACEDVEEDSVAQLIGYDIDGNEIYEGYIVRDVDGNEFLARLEARVDCEFTEIVKYWTLPFEQTAEDDVDNSMPLEFFNDVENTRRTKKWLKKYY